MADWSNYDILTFLELYEGEPIIWNPKHSLHKNKTAMNDAWLRLALLIEKPVAELKKKKESLMATFRLHLKKEKASITSGAGVEDIYRPTWFAFDIMERFLRQVYECEPTYNTEENVIQQSQQGYDLHAESNTGDINPTTTTPLEQPTTQHFQGKRRRSANPPELQEASKQMKQAFNTFNNVLNRKQLKEEDECDLFGKLIAKKLRKYSESVREEIMYKIEGFLYHRSRRHPLTRIDVHNRPSPSHSSCSATSPEQIHDANRPPSFHTSYSPPSPVQIYVPNRPPSFQTSYSPPSPVQIHVPNRPPSFHTSYSPPSPLQFHVPNRPPSFHTSTSPSPVQIHVPNRPSPTHSSYSARCSSTQISIPTEQFLLPQSYPTSSTVTHIPEQHCNLYNYSYPPTPVPSKSSNIEIISDEIIVPHKRNIIKEAYYCAFEDDNVENQKQ